jgi:hypothetical protein
MPGTARARTGASLAKRVAAAGSALALLACAEAGPAGAPDAAAPPAPGAPAFVLLIAVDQLRADRLDARLPGGLGRIAREGRVFAAASLEHARTETCPGHATMLTGRQPAGAGITGNALVERPGLRVVYCVADESPRGRVLGGGDQPRDGRSPRRLAVTALGDWLHDERPGARVHSVSGKDRSAITLGGQQADGVWWFDGRGRGGFTTSRWYRERLPEWVERRWSVGPLLAPVPAVWEHPSGDPPNGARADAYPGESPRWSITSPHPVKPEGDTKGSLEAFVASPFLDARTLDFARELVVEEQLGARGEIDLLALGLSGTDYVGHSYGPFSQEARDALLRLDRDLGDFLSFLDERLGPGRLIVALTADHGVLPLPEYLAEQGGRCPVQGGRIAPAPIEAALAAYLDEELGAASGEGGASAPGWLVRNGFELYFRPERAAASGVSLERAVEVAEAWLVQQPGVARVWRGSELDAGRGSEPMRTLYRNSRERAGGPELEVEPAYGCLFSPWPAGTSHGSPHDYDRDVPLVFMGPRIEAGRVSGRAAPVDIAPTLAAELGLAAPAELDGRVLPLRGAAAAR